MFRGFAIRDSPPHTICTPIAYAKALNIPLIIIIVLMTAAQWWLCLDKVAVAVYSNLNKHTSTHNCKYGVRQELMGSMSVIRFIQKRHVPSRPSVIITLVGAGVE